MIIFAVIFSGGVFIATLFGLALALMTLVGEVVYYRKKSKATDISHPIQKTPWDKFSLVPTQLKQAGKYPRAQEKTLKLRTVKNEQKDLSVKYLEIQLMNKNKVKFIK